MFSNLISLYTIPFAWIYFKNDINCSIIFFDSSSDNGPFYFTMSNKDFPIKYSIIKKILLLKGSYEYSKNFIIFGWSRFLMISSSFWIYSICISFNSLPYKTFISHFSFIMQCIASLISPIWPLPIGGDLTL